MGNQSPSVPKLKIDASDPDLNGRATKLVIGKALLPVLTPKRSPPESHDYTDRRQHTYLLRVEIEKDKPEHVDDAPTQRSNKPQIVPISGAVQPTESEPVSAMSPSRDVDTPMLPKSVEGTFHGLNKDLAPADSRGKRRYSPEVSGLSKSRRSASNSRRKQSGIRDKDETVYSIDDIIENTQTFYDAAGPLTVPYRGRASRSIAARQQSKDAGDELASKLSSRL